MSAVQWGQAQLPFTLLELMEPVMWGSKPCVLTSQKSEAFYSPIIISGGSSLSHYHLCWKFTVSRFPSMDVLHRQPVDISESIWFWNERVPGRIRMRRITSAHEGHSVFKRNDFRLLCQMIEDTVNSVKRNMFMKTIIWISNYIRAKFLGIHQRKGLLGLKYFQFCSLKVPSISIWMPSVLICIINLERSLGLLTMACFAFNYLAISKAFLGFQSEIPLRV